MYRPIPSSQSKLEHPVLERCDFFTKASVWPHTNALDARQWLKNFRTKDEKEVAQELLKSFMFFPERMTRELLRSAVRKIIPYVVDFTLPANEALAQWHQSAERILFIPVRGENPSPADSGFHYARLCRDMFGISEDQLPSVPQVLPSLLNRHVDGSQKIVVFVDDFVGTGQQFLKVWKREFEFQFGMELSFLNIAPDQSTKFFYCPLVATSYGIDAIKSVCGDDLILCPAHTISQEYNALSESSRVWSTPEMQMKGPAVLAEIAERVGMPDTGGESVNDWQGYHGLGLGLVLHDAMPDACLGVYRYKENGWLPLFNNAV